MRRWFFAAVEPYPRPVSWLGQISGHWAVQLALRYVILDPKRQDRERQTLARHFQHVESTIDTRSKARSSTTTTFASMRYLIGHHPNVLTIISTSQHPLESSVSFSQSSIVSIRHPAWSSQLQNNAASSGTCHTSFFMWFLFLFAHLSCPLFFVSSQTDERLLHSCSRLCVHPRSCGGGAFSPSFGALSRTSAWSRTSNRAWLVSGRAGSVRPRQAPRSTAR